MFLKIFSFSFLLSIRLSYSCFIYVRKPTSQTVTDTQSSLFKEAAEGKTVFKIKSAVHKRGNTTAIIIP